MTLSSTHPPGGEMKLQDVDSTRDADGSITVSVRSNTRRNVRGVKAMLALAAMSLALFVVPGQAFAADPTDAQYGAPVEQVQAGLGEAQAPGAAEEVAVPAEEAEAGPSLPFTGLDIAALGAVALALTGTGVVLRRLTTIGDSEK
jgi:hypothetical protein